MEKNLNKQSSSFLRKITLIIVCITLAVYSFPQHSKVIFNTLKSKPFETTIKSLFSEFYIDQLEFVPGNTYTPINFTERIPAEGYPVFDGTVDTVGDPELDQLLSEIMQKYRIKIVVNSFTQDEIQSFNIDLISPDDHSQLIKKLRYWTLLFDSMGEMMHSQDFIYKIYVPRNFKTETGQEAGTFVEQKKIVYPLYYTDKNGPVINEVNPDTVRTIIHEFMHVLGYKLTLNDPNDTFVSLNAEGFRYQDSLSDTEIMANYDFPGFASDYGRYTPLEDTASIVEYYTFPKTHATFMSKMESDKILESKFEYIYGFLLYTYGIDLVEVYDSLNNHY